MPRLNYTNREKINREHCEILLESDADTLTVTAGLKTDSYGFPSEALITLVAYQGYTVEPFSLGTVGNQTEIRNQILVQFSSSNMSTVLFRVLVIDPSGKLLGRADQLRPVIDGEISPKGRTPILPFSSNKSLGQRIWKINFAANRPEIWINEGISDWNAFARSPLFQSIAYPQIIREIAMWVINEDIEEDMEAYHWVKFFRSLGYDTRDAPKPGIADDDDRNEWLDDLTEAFCKRHDFLDQLIENIKEAEND